MKKSNAEKVEKFQNLKFTWNEMKLAGQSPAPLSLFRGEDRPTLNFVPNLSGSGGGKRKNAPAEHSGGETNTFFLSNLPKNTLS